MTAQLEITTFDLDRLYTADEFEELDFPDDQNTYELIEGQIVMTPPPGDDHGTIAQVINRKLILFDPESKFGKIWQNTNFKLSRVFSPAPDLAFMLAARVPARSKKALAVRPDLVVEVWSPSDLASQSRRDKNAHKIRSYQTAGVPLIWAINPQTQTVEVYYPDKVSPLVKTIGDELSGEDILPGFVLAVKDLFE